MATPMDDIFYQELSSTDWSILLDCYSFHEFPDNKKVVKAYKNFYKYVAIGNAMLSKQSDSDGTIMKTIKSGYYGTMYFWS